MFGAILLEGKKKKTAAALMPQFCASCLYLSHDACKAVFNISVCTIIPHQDALYTHKRLPEWDDLKP